MNAPTKLPEVRKLPLEPELRPHPLALFLPMEGTKFDALVEDMRLRGQQEPIALFQGMILDGNNRYRACQRIGAEPLAKEYTGTDPIGFVLSANLHRRHLDETQRGIVAAKLANMRRGGKEANPSIGGIAPISQEDAATRLNVSVKTVERASKLISNGTPELVRAAEQGKVKVSAAVKFVEKPETDRQKLLADKSGDIVKAVKSLKEGVNIGDAYEHAEATLLKKLQPMDFNNADTVVTNTIKKLRDALAQKKAA
jgi:hypothetical protein